MSGKLIAALLCAVSSGLSGCAAGPEQPALQEDLQQDLQEAAQDPQDPRAAQALQPALAVSSLAGTDVVTATLTGSPLDLPCNGSTQVRVTFKGQLLRRTVDIMLVLDRSGSMAGAIGDLKSAAKGFVDQIDTADGTLDGAFAGGSRIGVVSFATSATLDVPLTGNAGAVKAAIDSLSASGLTNHEAAINTAQGQLGASPNRRVMVIFTDGETTQGGDATDDAAAARAAGTEIFAIGLGSFDRPEIESWVSPPIAAHTRFTSNSGALQALFAELADSILEPAATGAAASFTLGSHFTASGAAPSKGTASASGTGVSWTIGDLGDETVTLTFLATHDNTRPGGVEPLLASSTYSDREGHVVSLPNPSVRVHGCAATASLLPESDINVVGDTHTVVATVRDDFGAPVPGITVSFSVVGGTSSVDGEPSAPTPSAGSGVTNAAGQVSFTYTNNQAATDQIIATVPRQPNVAVALTDTAGKTWIPIRVIIDIKPGSDPSSIGANSKGKIPVALFGSATFNVLQVNDSTVRFGDPPSTLGDAADDHGAGHPEEKNGDGFLDKVYHFYFPDTHLDPGDVEGCLSGEINGFDFQGCSDVNVVPGP